MQYYLIFNTTKVLLFSDMCKFLIKKIAFFYNFLSKRLNIWKIFTIFAPNLQDSIMKEETLKAAELLEKNVKQIAWEQHRSLAQLAKAMGISAPSLTHLLKGNPQLDKIQRIADTLNVPVSALFREPYNIEGFVVVNGEVKHIRSQEDLDALPFEA